MNNFDPVGYCTDIRNSEPHGGEEETMDPHRPEIDLESFARVQSEAFVLDVREPDEYAAGHVPGATLVPAGSLAGAAGALPADRTIYVICASGNRSLRAARELVMSGLDAVSVAGGTAAWIRSGRPVRTGAPVA